MIEIENPNKFETDYVRIADSVKNIDNLSDEQLLELYQSAKEFKTSYNQFQLVVKRNCNSLYGVSANQFFSLHDTDCAEDITITGKHYAVIVDRAINKFFTEWNKPEVISVLQEFYPDITEVRNFTEYQPDTKNDVCVYGDTDSRYVRIDFIYKLMGRPMPESDKELADFMCFMTDKFINKIIADTINADCEARNSRKGYMKMAHEITTRKSIFLKKKKYIAVQIWKDGLFLSKPKMKYQGVEIKKGAMSEKAKNILKKLLDRYLLEGYTIEQLRQEVIKIIKYIKIKRDKDLIYQISSVSGLSDMKLNDSGVWVSKSGKNHIQMQIALSWNNFIEKYKLQGEYKPAFEGQKMQFYYCAEGSDFKVIGVPDDYEISSIKQLPEPDWNRMIEISILKPFCRYILDKQEIDAKDIEAFLLGVKVWNFNKE